ARPPARGQGPGGGALSGGLRAGRGGEATQAGAAGAVLGGTGEADLKVRAPLTLKITVLIVVVLIVGFGVSTILTIQREAELLVEQGKQAARELTATPSARLRAAMAPEPPRI